jgi:hypothetical protein
MFAAKPVVAVGKVTQSYLESRMVGNKPRRETYVFMAGGRFNGSTVDHTFDRTTFRDIAEYLAPKLTLQNYWPSPEIKDADLLLIVHWGVTQPRASFNEMTARVDLGVVGTKDWGDLPEGSPGINPFALEQRMYQLEDIAELDSQAIHNAGTARLLGYSETLIKLGQSALYTDQQYTLESDMRSERYFIIVRAYNLRAPTKGERSRPVWTLHLNTASAGNNFKTAMASMSTAGGRLFGRKTEGVSTIRVDTPNLNVELHDLVILGEAK